MGAIREAVSGWSIRSGREFGRHGFVSGLPVEDGEDARCCRRVVRMGLLRIHARNNLKAVGRRVQLYVTS